LALGENNLEKSASAYQHISGYSGPEIIGPLFTKSEGHLGQERLGVAVNLVRDMGI
jgi:hypothetical protein